MHPPAKWPGYCTCFTSMRDSYRIIGWEGYDGQPLFNINSLVFDMDISKSSGYRDFIWAIELNRLGLDLIGLWPKTDGVAKKRRGSDIRASFSFIMIGFASSIPLLHALIRVWGNMTLMIDNLRVTLPILTVLFELVIMRWKQTVILSIIKEIAEDWTALKLTAERDVMIKQAQIARLIAIFGYVTMGMGFVILIFFPCFGINIRHSTNLTDRNKPLPLQTYYIFDTDKSPQFILTFISQAIGMFLTTITYVAVNAFLAFVILHICGQLENFKRRLVNLASCKDFNKALSSSIMIHLRLIKFTVNIVSLILTIYILILPSVFFFFSNQLDSMGLCFTKIAVLILFKYADNIENTFTLILFLSVLLFGVVFCLCGFILLTVINDEKLNSENFSQISYMFLVVFGLLMQIFIYCFGGDLIAEQCDAVYRTICDLEWYTLEPRKTRNFILLMLVAKEPFRITAGKVLPLTMTTFCSLLKTTAGYISVLLTMRS